MKNWIIFSALLAALTIILGAIGAHSLKDALSEVQLNSFATGVRYQMYHVLAIIATVLLSRSFNVSLKMTLWLFMIGILFFSGSIFVLSTIPLHGIAEVKRLGLLTPIGGLVLVGAWLSLAIQLVRKK